MTFLMCFNSIIYWTASDLEVLPKKLEQLAIFPYPAPAPPLGLVLMFIWGQKRMGKNCENKI